MMAIVDGHDRVRYDGLVLATQIDMKDEERRGVITLRCDITYRILRDKAVGDRTNSNGI